MDKKTKILIIGFGSIGQRHYKNLKKLGYHNLWVYDIHPIKTLKHEKIKTINKLTHGSLKEFDIVFVCTPTNSHIQPALLAAKAGCHLFIEKPLSHTLKDIDKLKKICQQKKLITLIGCNMRFHPCLKFIKKYLEQKKLGKVYTIHHELGSYMPRWMKTDYRQNFRSKKSMGGGIILDDIHEFDLLFWLNDFKPVIESKFIYDKVSNLKINTEDACIASFKFNNKVLGSVRCDYLQQSLARNVKVVGEKGNLEWDLNHNIVWLKTAKGAKKLFQAVKYNFDQVYIEQTEYFMNCVKNKRQTFNDIKIAKQVLKYCVKR